MEIVGSIPIWNSEIFSVLPSPIDKLPSLTEWGEVPLNNGLWNNPLEKHGLQKWLLDKAQSLFWGWRLSPLQSLYVAEFQSISTRVDSTRLFSPSTSGSSFMKIDSGKHVVFLAWLAWRASERMRPHCRNTDGSQAICRVQNFHWRTQEVSC